jgi:glucokinase
VRTLGIDIGGTAVKAALVQDGVVEATGLSRSYVQPDLDTLRQAIGGAVDAASTSSVDAVGLCVPGIVDEQNGVIRTALNVPSLVGVDPSQMVREAMGLDDVTVLRFTDAHAAAHDLWNGQAKRMAAISIGTGVGLCVLDEGEPLDLGFGTPGHLGQVDVSLDEVDVPVGPDGGRGGLEAYIGWPALQVRYGSDGQGVHDLAACLMSDDAPLRALARGIRIVHAIYRPQRIVMLGGVGIALKPCLAHLRSLVAVQLTSLAREGWTLETGHSLHHAASGAARLAAAQAGLSP